MTHPTRPPPTDPDQHAPGISRTLEDNRTPFTETSPEERTEPKVKPVLPQQ